jgi:3-oxoadipate enol-lactonase
MRWTPARSLFVAAAPLGSAGVALGLAWAAARSRPERPGAAAPVPPPGLPPARIENVAEIGELFFRDSDPTGPADRPVLVLLHGWMYPADTNWFPAYGPLSEVGRVIAPDHRGHGRGLRASTPFRLTDAADDVAALLRHLGAPPAVLVGYSMGGPIAQLVRRRHPDVVRGLVLCATSATFNVTPRDRWTWRTMGLLQLLLRLVPRHWWERVLTWQAEGAPLRVTRMLNSETPPEVRSLLPWMVGELDRGSAEDVAEAGRELSRFDARDWIGALDVPTAVVVTSRDVLVPPDNQRDLARRIPGAAVYEVPLDHDAAVAHADVFVPALRKAVEHVLS